MTTAIATLASLPDAAVPVAQLGIILGIPEAYVPTLIEQLVALGDPDGNSTTRSRFGVPAARVGV